MNSTSALLQQLRIDRDEDQQPANGNRTRWLIAALVVFPVVGAVGWWMFARPEAVPEQAQAEVRAAIATPPPARAGTLAATRIRIPARA